MNLRSERTVFSYLIPILRPVPFRSRRGFSDHAMNIHPGAYFCEIDAEPLERYKPGGYHPVRIGDRFQDGRYRILHKLGWGGYSTVWLAHDSRASRLTAVKILVAERSTSTREADILRQISADAHSHSHPHRGQAHLGKILDMFDHNGPNGTHKCLLLDLEGTNAQDLAQQYSSGRLPGCMAWTISKQITQALAFLHSIDICYAGQSFL